MRHFIGLVSLACLVLLGLASCARPPASLPADLVAPDATQWPEARHRQTFVDLGRPATTPWKVTVDNEQVLVSRAQLTAWGLSSPPAQAWLSQDQDVAWKARMNQWRRQQVDLPHAWQAAGTTQGKFVVFVSPDCGLCEALIAGWPAELPMQVIPVASPATLVAGIPVAFSAHWCLHTLAGEQACKRGLAANAQHAQVVGVLLAPALVAPDGRLLAGWPDANWLRRWWDPQARLGPSAPPLGEPDL
jgi:hypothetical protein